MAQTATRRRNPPAQKPAAARKASPPATPKAATRSGNSRAAAANGKQRKSRRASSNGSSAGNRPRATSGSRTSNRPQSRNAKGKAGGAARKTTGPTRKAPKARPRRGPLEATKDVAGKATDAMSEVPKPNKLARRLALRAVKTVGKRVAGGTLEAGATIIRAAAERAAATGSEVAEKASTRRLPIQRYIEVAVPLDIAWEEWLAFEAIPEGVHTITDIERDGDELVGVVSGPRHIDWAAEIIDERERESFAWHSYEGTDCAGLVTFHSISERLTRLELNLDVVPTGVGETVQLASHLAHRKAEADLRRFKARLELINPDLYEEIAPPKEDADEDGPPEQLQDEPLSDEDEQDHNDPGEEQAA